MSVIELLKSNPTLAKKYGKHPPKYGPKKDCKHCGGSGVKISLKNERFCICTYLSHDCSDKIGTALGIRARKMLKEMQRKPWLK